MKAPFIRKLAATGAPMFIHPCAVCGSERAHFGFDVSLRKDQPGFWLCYEHKDREEEIRASLHPKSNPQQGSLL